MDECLSWLPLLHQTPQNKITHSRACCLNSGHNMTFNWRAWLNLVSVPSIHAQKLFSPIGGDSAVTGLETQ